MSLENGRVGIMSKKTTFKISIIVLVCLTYIIVALISRNSLQIKYTEAKQLLAQGQYQQALEVFESLGANYRDNSQYIEITKQGIKDKEEREEKQAQYDNAKQLLDNGNYQEAEAAFLRLKDFLDSEDMAKESVYAYASRLFSEGRYNEASQEFQRLKDYKNSKDMALESTYEYARELFDKKDYTNASAKFQDLGEYKESKIYSAKIALIQYESQQNIVYQEAVRLYNNGEYALAAEEFAGLEDYLDSRELLQKCYDAIKRSKLATTISAGIRHVVGIKENGTAVSTGYNEDGRSDIADWGNLVSISAKGEITIGLMENGRAVAAHQRSDIDLTKWSDLIAVSAGEQYVVGLKNDGSVISQGHDAGDGQRDVDDWKDITAIATGWRHTVGLKQDGSIEISGFKDKTQLAQIEKSNLSDETEWRDIIEIAAGGGCDGAPGAGHTVGLRADGRVCAVGDNEYGQCEVSGWENVVAIAAGDWHTVGLCSDGTVLSTRPDPEKYPDLYMDACNVEDWKGENIVAISAGCGTTVGLRADGTIIAAGYNDYQQTQNANQWDDIRIGGVRD